MKSFQQGTRPGPNGFGFSVQTTPGISVDELARGGLFPNNRVSVSTVERLQSIPGVRVRFPTPGFGAYHGTVVLPAPPPSGLFEAITATFTQQPNPHVVPR